MAHVFTFNQTDITQTTLAEKAVMVRLKLRQFRPYAADSIATRAAEEGTGVRGAGRYNKRLLKGCKAFDETTRAFHELYTFHMKHTVPWLDEGARILPVEMYDKYVREFRQRKEVAEAAVERLAQDWPAIVKADVARLKGLGRWEDYPTDVREKYGIEVRFQPVPHVGDWRVEISEQDKATLQASLQEADATIRKHLLETVMSPIRAIVNRLYEYRGEKGQRWHASLVEAVHDMLDRVPALNVNNDPEINALVDDIRRAMAGINNTALKNSQLARDKARESLGSILSKMGV